MSASLPFDAVLFDCDGVLVDSEPITNRVLRDMLEELGWSLTLETLLIAGFYACAWLGPLNNPNGKLTLAASIFALAAMGVQSALVRLLMKNVASTNVMTTNTSLLGVDTAEFFLAWNEKRKFSRSRRALNNFRKARRRFRDLLQITLGFIAGAALGAAVYHEAGVNALIAPVGIVAALAAWAFERDFTSGNL